MLNYKNFSNDRLEQEFNQIKNFDRPNLNLIESKTEFLNNPNLLKDVKESYVKLNEFQTEYQNAKNNKLGLER